MARKEKKYHFIYKTTNLLSGKYYIGMHSTDDLNDGYMGSGKRLKCSLNKYGKENHKVENLEFLNSREELKKREEDIVNLNEIAKESCMNLMTGGQGGFVSEESQKKRSIAANKALNYKLKNDLKFNTFFRLKISEGVKNTYQNGRLKFESFNFNNKKHSKESRDKIAESNKLNGIGVKNSQYGTCWINDGKNNKKINKKILNNFLNEGWLKGSIKKFSKYEFYEMVEMRKNNFSYQKIADKFSLSKTTVINHLKNLEI